MWLGQCKNVGGYSLIELMVAACLGLIIISAIQSMSSRTLEVLGEIKASSEVLENGQYLSGLLNDEIGMAGFYGDLNHPFTTSSAPPHVCQIMNKQQVAQAMSYPIAGEDNVASGYKLCSTETLLPGTDIIVVRRASVNQKNPRYRLKSKEIYIQGTWAEPNPIIEYGRNSAAFKLTKGIERVPVRAWQQTVYYVSKDNVFKRRRFLKGQYSKSEPLVDGVQDFQVEYAVSSSEGTPACNVIFLTPPLTDEQWGKVVAIRFHVLARSPWRGLNHKGKLFNYASKTYKVESDGYYQLFTALAPIMNKLPSRIAFDDEK